MAGENYVVLIPGVPKRLIFSNYAWADTTQVDPLFKAPMTKRKLIFQVTSEDGNIVSKIYSTLRGKEWALWEPFLGDGSYKNFEWTLIYSKNDFASEVQISARPL